MQKVLWINVWFAWTSVCIWLNEAKRESNSPSIEPPNAKWPIKWAHFLAFAIGVFSVVLFINLIFFDGIMIVFLSFVCSHRTNIGAKQVFSHCTPLPDILLAVRTIHIVNWEYLTIHTWIHERTTNKLSWINNNNKLLLCFFLSLCFLLLFLFPNKHFAWSGNTDPISVYDMLSSLITL